ncbi:hypothetical protein Trydic_g20824 [Trypoxylus dichotomus]
MDKDEQVIDSDVSSDCSDKSEKYKFYCDIGGCTKKFTKNRKLQNHLRLHKGERPFECDVENCFKTYTNSSHLQRHKKRKHSEYNERITCSVTGCNRELANKSCLKKHIYRWHNPNRIYPFMCNECPQGFYRKKQLQQHVYLHTGQLPYRCEQCELKFPTISDKNKHKRKHKIYTCECANVSKTWSSFLAHRKTCGDLKSHQCSICGKNFSTKAILKMHVNTHLNRNDRTVFPCPYEKCYRYYFYKKNLTFHINTVHKKIARPKIPCTYDGCHKLLGRMSTYKNHLKTHEVTNKPKIPRKPRKDKGQHKKKIIDDLLDLSVTEANNELTR